MTGAPNILLTGFMGTGKSVVGRALAAALDREFVDTDHRIVDGNGPIPAIFAERGEAAFRGLELELARELAARTDLVVATGGGMLLQPAALDVLGGAGRVFCLAATPAPIIERVLADGVADRPLLSGDEPELRVGELLAERAERYRSFEQIPTDGRTVAEIVADIVDRLETERPETERPRAD